MILEGKKAIITGGGRGIGRGIALAFAEQGCDVAISARSRNELEQVASEVETLGRRAHIFECDLGDVNAAAAMVETAANALGCIDLLINNAGYAAFAPFDELTDEDWAQTFAVNVLGVAAATRAALPALKTSQGRIINIGSVASLKPIAGQSAYVASKHALVGLSETLAMELKPHGISVHTICPGGVDTKLAADAMPDRDRDGWMTPEDIAHTALYLAGLSPRATTDTIVVRRFESVPIGG